MVYRCQRTGTKSVLNVEQVLLSFHRFPKPGSTNMLRATAFATYCWPECDWSSLKSLVDLHKTSVALIFKISSINGSKGQYSDDEGAKETGQKMEVRAVFINCDTDEGMRSLDSDMSRFQRQELFKHNALRECVNKVALTVRLTSEPADMAAMGDAKTKTDVGIGTYCIRDINEDSSGDDYIPVDHVFEGSNRKRVRLLNPYILRLRRNPPLQAYKLQRIDTVNGVLTNSAKEDDDFVRKRDRSQRNYRSAADEWSEELGSETAEFTLEHEDGGRHSYSVRVDNSKDLASQQRLIPGHATQPISKDCGLILFSESFIKTSSSESPYPAVDDFAQKRDQLPTGKQDQHLLEKRDVCPKTNQTWRRDKRHKQKYIPENDFSLDYQHGSKKSKNYHSLQNDKNLRRDQESNEDDVDKDYERPLRYKHAKDEPDDQDIDDERDETVNERRPLESVSHHSKQDLNRTNDIGESARSKINYRTSRNDSNPNESINKHNYGLKEKEFALYEIGSPNLWYSVQVQLFEKMSTPEGKTVWNDLTNGEEARVSSVKPDWMGRDMTVRYRPAEWVARDDFSLPIASLCLLEPLRYADNNTLEEERVTRNAIGENFEEYIIVPMEDIVGLDDSNNEIKRKINFSNKVDSSSTTEERPRRRVEVRISRALFGGSTERFGIAEQDSDKFLTLPHQKSHRAQIDLEVRADENQLVRVGSSGALTTVVADSTRRKRTVLTIQAMNSGLASARFRAVTRDCGPELSGLINEKGSEKTMTAPILLPPQHTRKLTLELPIEIPVNLVHCSVALLNDDDESVAIRDVAIRKGDRCFCVWHCDCVCLGEDPKLLCREMAVVQQLAAGLTPQEKPRLTRSTCYVDNVTVNVCVVMIGVLLMLLMLGAVKAILGLFLSCIGSWGLDCLLRVPRTLDQYYENSLSDRSVVYDQEGWPVHPDTCKRTVQLVSKPMEFVLNLIFFVALPCVVICNSLKICFGYCGEKKKKRTSKTESNIYNSAHDAQTLEAYLRRKKRGDLRRWMTPQAEELSTNLWQQALEPLRSPQKNAKPLLTKCCREQCGMDSEQDDTDYVLMQMQKSRESLAKSQKKMADS